MTGITFRWPHLPPSVNNLYFSRGKRRVLGSAGREFKNRFIAERGGVAVHELLTFEADNEQAYELELYFYLPKDMLFNASYGKSRATKSPFRQLDTSNLVKLFEDSVAELLGLRDRNNFTVIAHKRVAHNTAGVVAHLTPIDLENDPHVFRD